jgi:hypothetical protein
MRVSMYKVFCPQRCCRAESNKGASCTVHSSSMAGRYLTIAKYTKIKESFCTSCTIIFCLFLIAKYTKIKERFCTSCTIIFCLFLIWWLCSYFSFCLHNKAFHIRPCTSGTTPVGARANTNCLHHSHLLYITYIALLSDHVHT